MQDNELIKRIRQGERALFGELADRYYDDIYRYCYYQTGSEHAAWDCSQETFCHLMRFLDSYTERGKFKAYLLRIALNVCRDYFRRNGRDDLSYADLSDTASSGGLPVSALLRKSGSERRADPRRAQRAAGASERGGGAFLLLRLQTAGNCTDHRRPPLYGQDQTAGGNGKAEGASAKRRPVAIER